jgi:hypothetical protein
MRTSRVNTDARDRLPLWEALAKDLCDTFNLWLIDPDKGLVAPSAFVELVNRSFAWECFLQREKNSKL